jgi:hypothetical protein
VSEARIRFFIPSAPQREISWDETKVERARIIARFPWQFREKTDWAYSFEPGWLRLIERVCERVAELVPENERKYFGFSQVKEKYASGRFYFRGGPTYLDLYHEGGIQTVTVPDKEARGLNPGIAHRIQRTVRAAGDLTSRMCQKCGARGTLRVVDRYYITLCPGHQAGSTEPRRVGQ